MSSNVQLRCRTCYEVGAVYELDTILTGVGYRMTIGQFLAKMVPKIDCSNMSLPRQICANCKKKLHDAYKFVVQAEKINDELVDFAKHGKHDCLLEAPIDIPCNNISSNLTEIKPNIECMEYPIMCPVSAQSTRVKTKHVETYSIFTEKEISINPKKEPDENELFESVIAEEEHIYTSDVDDSFDYAAAENIEKRTMPAGTIPSKRKRGRPSLSRSQYKKDNLRKYDTGRQHSDRLRPRKHSEWNFGKHLYCDQPCRLIECKLCDQRFQEIIFLRQHIISHTDISTIRIQKDSDVVTEQFPSVKNIHEIKRIICADIESKAYDKYYSIVNNFGYELDLFDSDTDNPCNKNEISYSCELCRKSFNRKNIVFNHMKLHHGLSNLPYQCSKCQLEFVCYNMFIIHKRTQCDSADKKHQCAKCPGRFMWLENLKQHQCCSNNVQQITHELVNLIDNVQRYQCAECHRSFVYQKSLKRHMSTHIKSLNEMGHNTNVSCTYMENPTHISPILLKPLIGCALCSLEFKTLSELKQHLSFHEHGKNVDDMSSRYIKVYYDQSISGKEAEMALEISNAFKNRNLNKFYIARDDSGNEMYLSDSDSDDIENRTDKKFECYMPACEFSANMRKTLLKHQRNDHKGKAINFPYKCTNCNQGFVHSKLLARHCKFECCITDNWYQCDKCDARFLWLENLSFHIQLKHINPINRESTQYKTTKVTELDTNMCKSNGRKSIQCMICLSKHSKISDLRTHLLTHDNIANLFHSNDNSIKDIYMRLYPEENIKSDDDIVQRIVADIRAQDFDRFYSITNEVGYEMSIYSSESDSDNSESQNVTKTSKKRQIYKCDLCKGIVYYRKWKLFEHQLRQHSWNEAPYECDQCRSRFLCRILLEHHLNKFCKNTRKRFLCRKCPQRFAWKENLKMHMREKHAETDDEKMQFRSFDCVQCNRSFKMQKDLTRHMVIHRTDAPIFTCSWCPRRFYRKENLLMHITRHDLTAETMEAAKCMITATDGSNGKKRIICKVCSLSYSTMRALKAHLWQESELTEESHNPHYNYTSLLNYSITNELGFEVHLDDSDTDASEVDSFTTVKFSDEPSTCSIYTCEICNLSVKRKFEMFRHQRSIHKHEQLPMKCDKCVFRTVSKDILAHHMRLQCYNVEKKYQCKVCTFRFMWPENLEIHKNLIHPNVKEEDFEIESYSKSKSLTSQTIFNCIKCHRKYNRKDRLAAHMKSKHPISETVDDEPDELDAATGLPKKKPIMEKKYLCAFCGRAVSSSSNLIIHMRRHTGEKPFKCEFCNMAFPRSSDLQCHRRSHTGEKPHQCTVCGKAFARSYKLQTHMRIHSGERPYKCTYCDKSFTQSNDLTLHVRRHTGERPYVCGICGERFIQGTALKNHRTMRGHFENVEPRRSLLEQF